MLWYFLRKYSSSTDESSSMTGPAVSVIVLAPSVGAHHRPACTSGASSSVSAAAMAPCSILQPGSCRPSSPASAAAARLCARMLSPPNDSRKDAMHSFQTGASVHARSGRRSRQRLCR